MDWAPYAGAIATFIVALVGFYGMVSTRLAKLETMIGELRKDVEKHNSVIERTFKLESDMKTAFVRIDELKAKDERLEDKIDKR